MRRLLHSADSEIGVMGFEGRRLLVLLREPFLFFDLGFSEAYRGIRGASGKAWGT